MVVTVCAAMGVVMGVTVRMVVPMVLCHMPSAKHYKG